MKLTVTIYSFSYKKGLPEDSSGHGGGHYFDCRAVPNPGVLEEYKHLTGLDSPVEQYLEHIEAASEFYELTSKIAIQSVTRYVERGFTNLMVNYGCTGGQHRSVYFAEKLSSQLHILFPDITIRVHHREQAITKTL